MEGNQTSAQNDGVTSGNKQKHKRIPKLQGADLEGFPGVDPMPVKVASTDDTYSIVFRMLALQAIEVPEIATQCISFAQSLDREAKEKRIGKVTGVYFDDGEYEAVLTLDVRGSQENPGIPAKHAFRELRDFIDKADILRKGLSGVPATWKAKVRNTTIVDGSFGRA